MQIIEITKEQFDRFAIMHKNHNFYQTSQYGTLMSRHGFMDSYLALVDDNNNILAASLVLVKKLFLGLKYGYAPRGFLIDFNDLPLLTTFTKLIRQFLKKFKFIYLKIDPYVVHMERDEKGEPILGGQNNQSIIETLNKLNYVHHGFNLYFENLKPRWNAVTKISCSAGRLFTLFDKDIRSRIRSAERKGITVYKGTKDDIKVFYCLIDKKHTRSLDYYIDYYDIFSENDMFDIYFAKLNVDVYLKNSKDLYDKELARNNELANLVQQNINNNHKYINEKMVSDKLLNNYKNNVLRASNLFKTNPEGIIIATSSVIKYDKELFFLIDGYDKRFKSFPANHLLRWKIIEEYALKGYLYVHQNGITGDFRKENKYYGLNEFKLGFNANVREYIGEFDLVVNKQLYFIYNNIKPVYKFINRYLNK
jgi:lipid II:glycine glycyltransferase (peptidoglycan interpeptide bridge formation enzyme)